MIKPSYGDYLEYQRYLGTTPDFMRKYLELEFMIRLKYITLLCGMENASPDMYDFNLPHITRFSHSLNDAKITYKLTHSKEKALASLFHDVASPTWCHVVDYMNNDFVLQESTEDKTAEILLSSNKLFEYLKSDDIRLDDVLDFKKYTVCDLPRPKLCADRLENTLSTAYAWMGSISLAETKQVIDALTLVINEDLEEEIGLKDEASAKILVRLNNEINTLTQAGTDTYMMIVAAEILKRCIEIGVVKYDDLFRITEGELIRIIEASSKIDAKLAEYYYVYKNATVVPDIILPDTKQIILTPYVNGKRIK